MYTSWESDGYDNV